MNILRILLTLPVLFTCNVALSQLYKWVDDNGNVHYGDKPTNASNTTEIKIKKPVVKPQKKSSSTANVNVKRPSPPVYRNQSHSQWVRENEEYKKQWNRYQQQSNSSMVQDVLKKASQRGIEINNKRLADEERNRITLEKSMEQNRLSYENNPYAKKLQQENKKRQSDLNKIKRQQRKERKRQQQIDKYWR